MVNLLLRDVILVNLGFHMCSHCLPMLVPFSQALRTINTHRVNRLSLDEPPFGDSTLGWNDPIPNSRPPALQSSPLLTDCRSLMFLLLFMAMFLSVLCSLPWIPNIYNNWTDCVQSQTNAQARWPSCYTDFTFIQTTWGTLWGKQWWLIFIIMSWSCAISLLPRVKKCQWINTGFYIHAKCLGHTCRVIAIPPNRLVRKHWN